MSGRVFFDTTVLIYSVSAEDDRAVKAERLLSAGGSVSVQVLNEFASVCRRKLKWSWTDIDEAIGAIRALCEPVVPLDLETHERGLKIAAQTGYHVYDAMIVAAGLQAACDVLYSEDMQDGRRIEGLVIRNPFEARER